MPFSFPDLGLAGINHGSWLQYKDASLSSYFYDFMAPRPKNLCACGCGLHVTRYIELGHLNGRRSALLAANVLSQNQLLFCSRKRSSKLRLMLPSRHARKQELIGHPSPALQSLSRKTSQPDRLSSENPFSETGEAFLEYDGFPQAASEAGPSGVRHDSPFPAPPYSVDLDESVLAQRSPAPVTQNPCSSAGHQYGLSTQRRSRRITERVERIGRVRWGTNHVQFIEREEREEEEEEEASITDENSNLEDEEGHGDDEFEDEEDMPFAEPGQEGISVWDLLGEGFWKEVVELGRLLLDQFYITF